VKRLGEPERVDEIARMLGGIDITEQARAHAREMLAHAATAAAPARKKRAPAARR
jgi:DNA repair protein RecN (Recombination protein N)